MSAQYELRVKFGKKGEPKLLTAANMDDVFESTFRTSLRLELGITEDLDSAVLKISPEGEPATFWHSCGDKVYDVLKSYVTKGALPDPAWKQPLMIVAVRSSSAHSLPGVGASRTTQFNETYI